jgi:lipopolysaccharide/colanic/teichoic acid biosynthesis glycosyltransferase
MNMARDNNGQLLDDEQRLTPLGKFLRHKSIDELPQLWNILRGDLSLVGPRPLFESYISYYTPTEHRRHLVRPGLTGWAQIHGRNLLDFDRRLAMDVWYVDHMSLLLDLRILLSTVGLVLRGEGITPPADGTAVPLDVQRQNQQSAHVSATLAN